MSAEDPPVITFDRESLLNALLYGSDEFNDKISKEVILRIMLNRVDDTGVAEGGPAPLPFLSPFCVAKVKKRNKGKKERVSNQKLLTRCHQGQNVTVLVINTFQCSMATSW